MILVKLNECQRAIDLIAQHNITLDDDLADSLTPEVGVIDNEARNKILMSLGKISKKQQN